MTFDNFKREAKEKKDDVEDYVDETKDKVAAWGHRDQADRDE